MNENEVSKILLDSAFTIHRAFGRGLLESVYKECNQTCCEQFVGMLLKCQVKL